MEKEKERFSSIRKTRNKRKKKNRKGRGKKPHVPTSKSIAPISFCIPFLSLEKKKAKVISSIFVLLQQEMELWILSEQWWWLQVGEVHINQGSQYVIQWEWYAAIEIVLFSLGIYILLYDHGKCHEKAFLMLSHMKRDCLSYLESSSNRKELFGMLIESSVIIVLILEITWNWICLWCKKVFNFFSIVVFT